MEKFSIDEVKKGLERCGYDTCDGCPYIKVNNCIDALMIDALGTINLLQEEREALYTGHENLTKKLADKVNEVERLQKANGLFKYLKEAVHRIEINGKTEIVEYASEEAFQSAITKKIDLMCNVQTAKTEAYEEFAERLKGQSKFCRANNGLQGGAVWVDDIDHTLKELKEGNGNG